MPEMFQHFVTQYGYAGIFAAFMLGLIGLPVPDESLLTLAGFMVRHGYLHLVPTIASAFGGTTSGITVSYWLGRTFGVMLIRRYGKVLRLSEERFQKVEQWFEHFGKWTLTFGYFVPGVRHLVAIVAGSSKLKAPIFGLYAYAGGLIWSSTFILLGYYIGLKWESLLAHVHLVITILIVALVAAAIIYFFRRRRISPNGK